MSRGVQEKTRELYPHQMTLDKFLDIIEEHCKYSIWVTDRRNSGAVAYPEEWIEDLANEIGIEYL